ncbi:hypothetical protein, partial [Metallibacterium scheffleri]|uniref:hypothetical protein n=1 Tax=Metallibacterium scheffleri TaxID=993689 RepID=UPI0026EE4107
MRQLIQRLRGTREHAKTTVDASAHGAVLLASSLQHAHKAALLRLREQAAQLDALARLQARHLAEQQGQMRNQLRRLSDLTGILSSINHLIDTAQDEVG